MICAMLRNRLYRVTNRWTDTGEFPLLFLDLILEMALSIFRTAFIASVESEYQGRNYQPIAEKDSFHQILFLISLT